MRVRCALTCLGAVCWLACSSAESDPDEACDQRATCEAVIHFSLKAGIQLGVDRVSVTACHDQACVETEIGVPAETATETTGTDPALSVTIERTDDPFYEDLQGVFRFDVTWTSSSRRIEQGDYVAVSVEDPDGGNVGNVVAVGHTVDEEADGACGCPRIELTN